MNVALVNSDRVAIGSLRLTDRFEFARYLVRRGHSVTLICGARDGDKPFPDIHTRFIRSSYRPFLAWFKLWPGVVRELNRLRPRPDVVLSDAFLLPAAY